MAGLLDLTDDPQTLGLLSLGLRLMSTPGRFGTALGQSGLGAIGDMQQARTAQEQRKSRAMQEQLMMQQLEAAKRQQAEQEAAKAKQAQDAALMRRLLNQPVESQFGGVGPGVPMRNTGVDPSTFLAQGGSMEALPQALMLNQALRPAAPKLTVSKPGDIARTETGEVAWQNPTPAEKPDMTPLAKLIAERDALPPGHPARPIYDARIAKETTHQPATSVTVNPEKAFAQAIGGVAAKNIEAGQDAAMAAQNTLGLVNNVRKAVKEGEVILGPGATVRQAGMRVGQLIGVGGNESADTLARTKAVEQGLAGLELEAAALMKGQGQITEAERKIIARAAAGKIEELTPQELDVALGAIERNAQRKIKAHQKMTQQIPATAAGSLAPLLEVPQPEANRVRRYNPATGKIE
jgi:hypothetical protein